MNDILLEDNSNNWRNVKPLKVDGSMDVISLKCKYNFCKYKPSKVDGSTVLIFL
jgi:hypothetical protein